jgi:hypothetical protein
MRHPEIRPALLSFTAAFAAGIAFSGNLDAQEIAELCPAADRAEGAVMGMVQDAEIGMILPGAEVTASWVVEGTRRRATAEVAVDGTYTLCGLPQDLEMGVRAGFANRRGPLVTIILDAPVGQLNLTVSLTAEEEPEELEEVEPIPEDGRISRVFSNTLITDEDLAALPEPMPLYDMLRQHHRLRFERPAGGGEVILFTERGVTGQPSLSGLSRFRGVQVYINDRRTPDSIAAIRDLMTDEIRRLEILSSAEASSRYGGDGYIGIISIRTR